MPLEPAGSLGSRPHLLRTVLNRLRRQEAIIDREYRQFSPLADPASAFVSQLRISVIMPVHETPGAMLEAALASVVRQRHQAWELCIADDGSSAAVQGILQAAASRDARVRVVRLAQSVGIAGATNAALGIATGEFCAFMDHDDELAADALRCVAADIAEHPDVDMVFTDEDQIDGEGRHVSPYFKPGWDPELMLSQNCVGHLAVYRRALLTALGGVREGINGSQDYDLALRGSAAVRPARIRHVPRVLYHWRQSTGSFSAENAESCAAAGRRAVADHLGGRAQVVSNAELPQWNTADFTAGRAAVSVSVIAEDEPSQALVRRMPGVELLTGFLAATGARGEVLVFAGSLASAEEGWLEVLASHAQRPEIGCVGARIDDRRGRVVNAGYVLDPGRIAVPQSCRSDAGDPGYRGQFVLARSVSAVSGQCLAIKRSLFERVGGFDPAAGAYGDVDLCLRVSALGYRCLWTPQARVRTSRPVARTRDAAGAAFMRGRWGALLTCDPYLNPNVTIVRGRLGLARQNRSVAS